MLNFNNHEQCCGCTSCANICPKNAISMNIDAMGFMYPEINETKCINCGLCEKACNFKYLLQSPLDKSKISTIYACRMKDRNELSKSQSGGATAAIANWILDKGGVVYGAAFGKHFTVHHTRATNRDERDLQRKSKYVQSDLEDSFSRVKEDLSNGQFVLFTGTGCQIGGLLQYIKTSGVDAEKLYTCDIICHGVPGPRLWKDYVDYVESKKLKKTITNVLFRDKEHFGWKSHVESFFTSSTSFTSFKYIFYDHVAYRPSCGVCPYASTHRLADFTVCDFWGYEKSVPEMGNDNKGLSLMFISSKKAEKAFEDFRNIIDYKQVTQDQAMQSHMQRPPKLSINFEQFEKDYKKNGFEYIMKKYGKTPFSKRFNKFIGKIICRLFGDKCVILIKNKLGKKQ